MPTSKVLGVCNGQCCVSWTQLTQGRPCTLIYCINCPLQGWLQACNFIASYWTSLFRVRIHPDYVPLFTTLISDDSAAPLSKALTCDESLPKRLCNKINQPSPESTISLASPCSQAHLLIIVESVHCTLRDAIWTTGGLACRDKQNGKRALRAWHVNAMTMFHTLGTVTRQQLAVRSRSRAR